MEYNPLIHIRQNKSAESTEGNRVGLIAGESHRIVLCLIVCQHVAADTHTTGNIPLRLRGSRRTTG